MDHLMCGYLEEVHNSSEYTTMTAIVGWYFRVGTRRFWLPHDDC